MADDTPPLKKANALARLGSLYLKNYNTAELMRLNAELIARVAELEEHVTSAEVEAGPGANEAASQPRPEQQGSTAASKTGKAKRPKQRFQDRHRPAAR
jgi:hypothetical protein